MKHCIIGELEFDLEVNRKMVFESLKSNRNFWECIKKSQKIGDITVENTDSNKKTAGDEIDIDKLDIDKLEETFNFFDDYNLEKTRFVSYILPQMLKCGNSYSLTSEEILDYCVQNEVDEAFEDEVVKFALSDFTKDKIAKNPKVKVQFN